MESNIKIYISKELYITTLRDFITKENQLTNEEIRNIGISFQSGDYLNVVRIVVGHIQSFINKNAVDDLNNIFSSLFCIIDSFGSKDSIECFKLICQTVVDSSLFPVNIIKILYNLYISLPSGGPEQYVILLNIYQYALRTKYFIIPIYQTFPSSWPNEKHRELLSLLEKISTEQKKTESALEYLLKYIQTYKEPPVKDIRRALIVLLKDIPYNNVSKYSSMLQLSKLPSEDNYLIDLLKIILESDYKSLVKYLHINKNKLKNIGIEENKLVESMKLLTLSTLASLNDSLPYSMISEELDIPLEKVEYYIIETIKKGLIHAKMDQSNNVVLVQKTSNRSFNHDQWTTLQNKLEDWTSHIQDIINVAPQ